ncbi:MAG: DUF4215 domain-containing protein [Myxococcales bacterium]|nr:DUF4215 domain-containing protein [Myxococcales bacterium]
MYVRLRLGFFAVTSLAALGWAVVGPAGCNAPVCGDGVKDDDEGEACDDGNVDDNDSCTNACQLAKCGDGLVYIGREQCDDANADETDGCTKTCELATCGDGVIQDGEECDDGNVSSNDDCLTTCQSARCGDGFVQLGTEACDDANYDDTDGCRMDCTLASCGDGAVQPGEECDDGNLSDNDACTTLCQNARCGDAFLQIGTEECDDGNQIATDGCQNDCTIAVCGDGIVQGGEECDDGNTDNQDACLSSCVLARCGDHVLEIGVEQCDDGNLLNGDGCNATCERECFEGTFNVITNGHCYMLFAGQGGAQQRTWFEARQRCVQIGAHLLEITDAAEQTSVAPLMVAGQTWIGLTDWLVEGSYVWDLGAMGEVPLGAFTNWDATEPNNSSQNTNNADCVEAENGGKWRTEACDQQLNYICERP